MQTVKAVVGIRVPVGCAFCYRKLQRPRAPFFFFRGSPFVYYTCRSPKCKAQAREELK
jgi:hypothetical protein